MGAKYVLQEPLLQALCDIVAEVRAAQLLAPALVEMCNDCDVQLFLVLPRIIWLRFLVGPTQQAELIRTLLPHRFSYGDTKAGATWDSGLARFITKFQSIEQIFGGDQSGELLQHASVWATLVKRAVSGETNDETYSIVSPEIRATAQPAIEDLMRDLEGYSIELQRHCPEDWNQCSAILVQCLTGSDSGDKQDQFRV